MRPTCFIADTAITNPSTGRWLSRDPIEESGGPNLYGFLNGQPISQIDHLGERPDGGKTWGLYEEHYVNGTFWWTTFETFSPVEPRIGVHGSYWVSLWDVSAKVRPCDDDAKGARVLMACAWKVHVTGRGEGKFWRLNEQDKLHKLHHDSIAREWWDALASRVQTDADVCMCRQKARCYERVTPAFSDAYQDKALLTNKRSDDQAYISQDVKDWIRDNQARIESAYQAAEAAVAACDEHCLPIAWLLGGFTYENVYCEQLCVGSVVCRSFLQQPAGEQGPLPQWGLFSLPITATGTLCERCRWNIHSFAARNGQRARSRTTGPRRTFEAVRFYLGPDPARCAHLPVGSNSRSDCYLRARHRTSFLGSIIRFTWQAF
jgi:hypothetical protein